LTFTSRGKAIGTEGVLVAGGGEVFVGDGVTVAVSVGSGWVADGVIISRVGVSVTGMFDGRLQARVAMTSTSAGNKVLRFILSP
jgi:hypothetical protein